MVLETVQAVKEKFKADHIANILTGQLNSTIKSYKHHELPMFGDGADKKLHFWNAVIRQALIHHLLQKDIENYGFLVLTSQGKEFIKKPYPIMITEDHEYEEGDDDDDAIGGPQGGKSAGAADEELFAMLKDLRRDLSKRLNLPPFVLFQDPSLEDMSTHYPITLDELKNCQGVGEGKAKKYGKEFISLIKSYVDEKEIIRPQDMVVKSIVNKSGIKVFIIQSIDKKLDFEDIANAKNLDFEDLLTEIEAIVNSGTKLNIDYYIDEVMDEDKRDDIYDYFRNDAASESLDEAQEELGLDYTEEEIRLVRIKFMSEVAN